MPPAVDHNGIIRNYTVRTTEENTGRQFLLTSHGSSQRIDSIHPYYNYTCAVAAVTVSAGPFSAPITTTTAEAGMLNMHIFGIDNFYFSPFLYTVPSGPAVNLAAMPTSSTSIALSWDPPLLHERNGVITSYTITLTSDGNATTFTARDTVFTIFDLRPFTSYTFNISASTRVGSGPVSGAVTETTLEDGM